MGDALVGSAEATVARLEPPPLPCPVPTSAAQVDEGVVGLLGVSNFTPALLDELLAYARVRPALNEVEFSPACFQHELVAACTERGVAVVGYSPFGACWLAKYHPTSVPWGCTNLLTDATVAAVAAEVGCTPALVLLRWSLQHGVAVIPMTTKPERAVESKRALDGATRLTAAQMARLDALNDARRGTMPSLEAHSRIIASSGYTWKPT